MAASLHAPHILEYTYTRSTGPIIGRYLAGLGEGRLLGIRSETAGVICPPQEYDPATGATLGPDALVDVGPGAVVVTWTWNDAPADGQPLDRPFAWALITPDGGDTPMLHAVDAGTPDAMSTGMRVTARFRPAGERQRELGDLVCFEPEETT